MSMIQKWVGFEESPDLEVKINTIIDFWSNPCNAPWYVYIETLYPALGRAILVLVDVSLLDLIKEYIAPRSGLTRHRNRKKGRRRGLPRGIPDTATLLAKMIPGKAWFEGRRIGAAEGWLWAIDDVVDRTLWHFLILDAATEGFYWWAMGIKAEQYCQPTNRPGMLASDSHIPSPAMAGFWFPWGSWTKQWGQPDINQNGHITTIPEGRWRISLLATYSNEHNGAGAIEVRARGTGIGGMQRWIVPPKGATDITMSFDAKGPTSIRWEYRTLGVLWLTGHQGVIIVQEA